MEPDPGELLDRYGLITEEMLSGLLGVGVKSLKNRPRFQLPEFVKAGRRRLYREESVREFLGIDGPLLPRQRAKDAPPSNQPRGMNREEAARYIGVDVLLFNRLVEQGRMPHPLNLGKHRVWDRVKLDAAFSLIDTERA